MNRVPPWRCRAFRHSALLLGLGAALAPAAPAAPALTVLHRFSPVRGGVNADGAEPEAGLAAPGDGWLYGSTNLGGMNRYGTVFRLRPDGTDFQGLHDFTEGEGGLLNSLVAPGDGFLYGTASAGTVFRLSLPPVSQTPRDPSGTFAQEFYGLEANVPPDVLWTAAASAGP